MRPWRPRLRPWTLRGCPLKPCIQSGPLKFVNTLCHVSYTCLFVNVGKILFVGQTNFWCIFKNGRALSCLYFVDEMYIKAKISTFFNMKAGNRFRQNSYMTLGRKVPYFFSKKGKNKNVFFRVVVSSNRELSNLKSLKFFTLSIIIVLIYVFFEKRCKIFICGSNNFFERFLVWQSAFMSPFYGYNLVQSKMFCLIPYKGQEQIPSSLIYVFWKTF